MDDFDSNDTLPGVGVTIYSDELIDLETRAEKLSQADPEFKILKLRLGLCKSLYRHMHGADADYQAILSRIREQLAELGL